MSDSCRYCEAAHDSRWLCGPAKKVLDALYAQGQRFDMPTVEFSEPIHRPDMFGAGTVLIAQFVVEAAVTPVAGINRPVLIFTGRDSDGNPLPKWLLCASPPDIKKVIRLVADMGNLAIRRARS